MDLDTADVLSMAGSMRPTQRKASRSRCTAPSITEKRNRVIYAIASRGSFETATWPKSPKEKSPLKMCRPIEKPVGAASSGAVAFGRTELHRETL